MDWLIRFLSCASVEMASTDSYAAAASPEELTKRSPEPHDDSEAGILSISPSDLIFFFCCGETNVIHFRLDS